MVKCTNSWLFTMVHICRYYKTTGKNKPATLVHFFTSAEALYNSPCRRSWRKVCQTVGKCDTLQGEDRNTVMSPACLLQMSRLLCLTWGLVSRDAPGLRHLKELREIPLTVSRALPLQSVGAFKQRNYSADCAASTMISNTYWNFVAAHGHMLPLISRVRS